MTFQNLRKIIKSKKNGTFSHVVWEKSLPVRKAYSNHIVTKRTEATVRTGVNYDNMKTVQLKRATGELPEENKGLPWGEWLEYPYFIKHKDSNYMRVSLTNNNTPKSRYFLDGKEVQKDQIVELCTKSAFSTNPNTDVFSINCENIISIR